MRNIVFIQPFVNGVLATEYDTHQDDKGDDTDGNNTGRYRLGHPAKGEGPAAPGQGRRTKEEHGRIGDQQKEYTVLQEGGPEPGAVIRIAIHNKAYDQGEYSYTHQTHRPWLVSAGYLKMFLN